MLSLSTVLNVGLTISAGVVLTIAAGWILKSKWEEDKNEDDEEEDGSSEEGHFIDSEEEEDISDDCDERSYAINFYNTNETKEANNKQCGMKRETEQREKPDQLLVPNVDMAMFRYTSPSATMLRFLQNPFSKSLIPPMMLMDDELDKNDDSFNIPE